MIKRLALLVAGVAVLAACSAAEAKPVLKVGQLGSAGVVKALLDASGQLKDLPYTIEWSTFPAGPQLIEAQNAGAVDVGLMADTPPIFAQAAGTPVKIVAAEKVKDPARSQLAILVRKDSPITGVAQLKGAKVATTQGTVLQYLLIKALTEEGLTYQDVTPVNLPPTDAVTALERGDVDAVTAIDPQVTQAVAGFGAKVLTTGAGLTSGLSFQVARTAALEHPALADYLQRYARAREWANANLDAWAPQYAKINNIPVDLARTLLVTAQATRVPLDDTVVAAQQDQADAFHSIGVLPKKLDVKAEFDPRFNEQVGK